MYAGPVFMFDVKGYHTFTISPVRRETVSGLNVPLYRLTVTY